MRNLRKRRSIFSYLKDQNCAVYLLQETFSQPQDELIWKTEWRGKIFFSHGSNHQKGVAILINPLFEITLENSWEDEDGRIVLINAYFNTVKVSLCNIYAPNNTTLQKVFIENLTEIHRMQIWRTTRLAPGTSRMEARLVRLWCFVLTMLFPKSLALLSTWSFCFALSTRFCVAECHRKRVKSSTAEKAFFFLVSSFVS